MSVDSLIAIVKSWFKPPENFSRVVLDRRLFRYQQAPAKAIIESVLEGRGLEFAVMFPRQSGKNETQAHVEAYLLNYCRFWLDAEIVKAQPTFAPQALNAMARLERLLSRNWLTSRWHKHRGYQVRLGRAGVTFLSAAPRANVAGATASLLLECDEAQDVLEAEWEKKFVPMGASTNVTVVYWGTAWTSRTLLAKTIRHLREQELRDGQQRVFVVTPAEVEAENPAYGAFVARQVAKHGRQHPLIRTQYFNEEIESAGGMFPASRRALMRGRHRRRDAPDPAAEGLYALLLDVAGQDEGATGDRVDLAALENPGRDATALTVVEVDLTTVQDALIAAPTYRVMQRKLWVGTKHVTLYSQLLALFHHWQARYLVVDNTGVGAGLAAFLTKALPAGAVISFGFNVQTKSDLGWDFLSLVDARRWQDYEMGVGDPDTVTFWQELEFCQHEVLPGQNRLMRWGVPNGTRDPSTNEPVHDDTLISAALATVLDKQPWHVDTGPTVIIRGKDPLEERRGY